MESFLVRFAARHFFAGRNHRGEPLGSYFPSVGESLSYLCACEIVKKLRALGFTDAVVCTPTGQPALPEDIINVEDVRSTHEFLTVWGRDAESESVSK
jgi:hypothetical protein